MIVWSEKLGKHIRKPDYADPVLKKRADARQEIENRKIEQEAMKCVKTLEDE